MQINKYSHQPELPELEIIESELSRVGMGTFLDFIGFEVPDTIVYPDPPSHPLLDFFREHGRNWIQHESGLYLPNTDWRWNISTRPWYLAPDEDLATFWSDVDEYRVYDRIYSDSYRRIPRHGYMMPPTYTEPINHNEEPQNRWIPHSGFASVSIHNEPPEVIEPPNAGTISAFMDLLETSYNYIANACGMLTSGGIGVFTEKNDLPPNQMSSGQPVRSDDLDTLFAKIDELLDENESEG